MNKQSRLSDKIGTFTAVPNSVIKLWPQIGLDGMALFLYLRFRTNNESEIAFPGYDDIRSTTGLTRNRIAQAIRSLESDGVLERKKRFGQSTIYITKIPSSTGGGLLEDSPVVRGVDSSSTGGGLSVVQGVHANKTDLNKTKFNKTKDSADKPRQPRSRDLHFENLSDICGMTPPERDWKTLVKTAAGQLRRYAKEIREAGATPEQILAFGAWWAANDWRGKKGQLPKPADVVQSWPLYMNGHANGNGRNTLADWQTDPTKVHDEYLRLNRKFLTTEQLEEAIKKGIHQR